MIDTICEVMCISRSAYFKFKKEGRPIIFLLEKYHDKASLQEFLKTNKIERLDNLSQLTAEDIRSVDETKISLNLLEDNAHFTLNAKIKELFTIFGIPDFAKFFPKKIFIKILDELRNERKFTHENAKDFLLSGLKVYETSIKKLEHPKHPQILYDFVESKLSKIEVYLLINNYEDYLT